MMTQLNYCKKCDKYTRQVLSKDYKTSKCLCGTDNPVETEDKSTKKTNEDKPSDTP